MRVMAVVEGERDRRFLIFGGVVLVAVALGFKSDLWAENQVWALGLGLIVVAAPVLLGYLRSAGEPPAVEHYIPVALGAITLAGLASSPVFNLQLWQFAGLSVLFGVGFVVAGLVHGLSAVPADFHGDLHPRHGVRHNADDEARARRR